MSPLSSDPAPAVLGERMKAQALVETLNAVLTRVPDRQWNYSRLRLIVRDLDQIRGPYVLGCDWIDVRSKSGRQQLEELERERTWGARHSDDLGFLELVSLRINHALVAAASATSAEWNGVFPVLRVVKPETLRAAGSAVGFWYEVEEVGGEEFERRGTAAGG